MFHRRSGEKIVIILRETDRLSLFPSSSFIRSMALKEFQCQVKEIFAQSLKVEEKFQKRVGGMRFCFFSGSSIKKKRYLHMIGDRARGAFCYVMNIENKAWRLLYTKSFARQ